MILLKIIEDGIVDPLFAGITLGVCWAAFIAVVVFTSIRAQDRHDKIMEDIRRREKNLKANA